MVESKSSFPGRCRIRIVSSQTLLRAGLRLLLEQEEDFQVEIADGQGNEKPDVILVVLDIFDQAQHHLASMLENCRGTPTLVLSPVVQADWVKPALAAGAAGYLPLDATPDELIHAIGKVHQGETFLHPSVILSLLTDKSGQPSGPPQVTLQDFSAREQEVLACLARGLSDRQIGQALFISVRTVQTHLENIYARLGVHSRTEAAILIVQSGWFPSSSA